jgi:hypothetical protein
MPEREVNRHNQHEFTTSIRMVFSTKNSGFAAILRHPKVNHYSVTSPGADNRVSRSRWARRAGCWHNTLPEDPRALHARWGTGASVVSTAGQKDSETSDRRRSSHNIIAQSVVNLLDAMTDEQA